MAASGGKSVRNVDGRSPGGGEESSESEGETEPAKSFHRRISTNREIKCAVGGLACCGRISVASACPKSLL